MNDGFKSNLQEKVRQLKERIKAAIESGYFNEAMEGIAACEKYAPGDPEIISMKAIMLIMDGRCREAGDMLKLAVNEHPFSFDLVFNLGYAYEQQERYSEAFESYLEAETLAASDEEKTDIAEAMARLKRYGIDIDKERKPKMVFFCKKGLDSFLDGVVKGLAPKYMVKKIIVESYRLIDEGMKWADICWFEWCDELISYGSKLSDAELKKIILRLHSYEAFTGYTANVNWKNVDRIIFVAEHIRDYALEQNRGIKLSRTAVIPNGVDTSKYRFRERVPGYSIAYVGYINYKKGPMLLLHTFNAIHKKDKRYRLHIAGMFQDARYFLYFRQMVREMGLEGSVFFEGWQEDIDKWLEDKDYILCTSVLESQGMGIMQAMSKGIKPVIHNFVGAKTIYPSEYLWNTIDEAVEMVTGGIYESKKYRDFIEGRYSEVVLLPRIFDLLASLEEEDDIKGKSDSIKANTDKVYEFFYRDKIIGFYLPDLNDHIQKLIFCQMTFYEKNMLEDIATRISRGARIVDVGANIGNHTVYFAKVCNAEKVYAFEPQKNIFDILKKNVSINKIDDRVELFNLGLGSSNGRGNITVVDPNNLGRSKISEDKEGEVEIRTLDDVLADIENPIDLIKIDVEGMAIDVLKGAHLTILKYKPLLYIEAEKEDEFMHIADFLKPYGYRPLMRFNATPTYLFITH